MLETTQYTADGHSTDGVGFLTDREYNRFVWAWENAGRIASWLYSAGNISASAETNVRVDTSSAPSLALPATYLAADEITSYLHALNGFRDAEQAARDKIGHEHANNLGKAVSAADHRWPREDKPHFVTHMRCGGCQQLTLKFRPPRWEGDLIKVDCWCGYELEEDPWSAAALRIQIQMQESS